MISMLVMTLIVLSIVSIGSYITIQMMNTSQMHTTLLAERTLIDQWQIAIGSSLKPIGENQTLLAPIGENDLTDDDSDGNPDLPYHTLPKGYGLKTTNAWGIPIIYCPVNSEVFDFSLAQRDILSGKVQTDGKKYDAGILSDFDGREYVAQSNLNLDPSMDSFDIKAIIISPLKKALSIPLCEDVKFNHATENFVVEGGTVRVIDANTVRNNSSSETLITDAGKLPNEATFNSYFNQRIVMKPNKMILELPNRVEPYMLSSDLIIEDFGPSKGREIIIKGESSSGVVIDSSEATVFELRGLTVSMENLTFSKNVRLSILNSDLVIGNSNIPSMTTENSNVRQIGPLSINGADTSNPALRLSNKSNYSQNGFLLDIKSSMDIGSLVTIDNSFLNLEGQTNLGLSHIAMTYISLKADSDLTLRSGLLNLSWEGSNPTENAAGIFIDGTSEMLMMNSQIMNEDPIGELIQVYGELHLDGSTVSHIGLVNSSITTEGISRLTITNGSTIGANTPASVGIKANGGSFVSGKGSSIFATKCWEGQIFTSVPSNQTGQSKPTDPGYSIFNQSDWKCN